MSRNVAPAYVVPDWLTPRQLARISPMAVSGAVLNGVLQAAFYIALPLYGLAMGLRTPEAAGLLVTGTIAGALAQFPVGWISDRVDRRTVIGGLSLVNMAIALALIAGALDAYLYPAIAAVGALTLPIYSLCVAHANDQLSPSQIVPASGTLVLALNLGVLAGAFAGPAMIGVLGAAGLPMLVAAGSALTALIALVRQIRVPAPDRVVAAQPISVQGGQAAGILPPEVVLEERQAL
jgi:predicted MFS family arabinose efflux permease